MQVNMIRTSESLTDDVLLADGWKFHGLGLYAHPQRQRNAGATQHQALKETLARHITAGGDTYLDFYGENPNDDQLMEILSSLNDILDPQMKVSMMETTLAKIQAAIDENDGRVAEVFEYITSEIQSAAQGLQMDEERRSLRSDFVY